MSEPNEPIRVVLVGTGTSVGKTWVGCALLATLRERGVSALGLKPVESGVAPDAPSDARELARAGAWQPSTPPYRFPEPLSPHLAARRAGSSVDLEQILIYIRTHESSSAGRAPPEVLVVETAGGLFSPVTDTLTNWDVARALDPACWVLVAADALGVLHDVTATLEAARARGRTPDLVVLSAAREPDASTGKNAEELERLGIAARPITLAKHDARGLAALADALLAPSFR